MFNFIAVRMPEEMGKCMFWKCIYIIGIYFFQTFMDFLLAYVKWCYFDFYYVFGLAPLYSTIGIKVFRLSRWKSSPMMRRRTIHMSCCGEDYICEVTGGFPPALRA